MLIEINNEMNPRTYKHRILQPDGALDAVLLAQQTVDRQIPVSMSWSGGIMPRGSRGDAALRAVDYVMFHTNGETPEEVHETIHAMRQWTGYDRPMIINEDGVSTFNLQAAVQEHVGWGYYDNGLGNYRDGFQNPPVNWKIGSPLKWLFFEQVARLTGSPAPAKPDYDADDTPAIEVSGLKTGQVLKEPSWIEAIVDGSPSALAHQAGGILHRRQALQLPHPRPLHAEQPGMVGHGGCPGGQPRASRGGLRHARSALHRTVFACRNSFCD